MSSYRDCSDNAVMTLASVFAVAGHQGDVEDLGKLLEAFRILRPDWAQWEVFEAWLYIRRSDWLEALRLLRQAEGKAYLPMCIALLGCCLYALQDATWHSYTTQALEQIEDPQAAQIAKRLVEFEAKRNEG